MASQVKSAALYCCIRCSEDNLMKLIVCVARNTLFSTEKLWPLYQACYACVGSAHWGSFVHGQILKSSPCRVHSSLWRELAADHNQTAELPV